MIAHFDNGSQYTSYEYTERLKRAGIAPSRGQTDTALDNARRKHLSLTVVEDGRIRRLAPLQVLDRYNQEVARETAAST